MNWKVISVFSIVVVFLLVALYRYKRCRKAGMLLGEPYSCGFFDVEPTTMLAEEHYYGKRDGKCYEIADYGGNMSFREVAMTKCMDDAEITRKKDNGELVEVIYE